MKIRLSELRVVVIACLMEGLDLTRVAKRNLNSRKIVMIDDPSATGLVLVDAKGNVKASITTDEHNGWHIVRMLWSSAPVDAVTILMVALNVWKKLDPSNCVSPAARAVIQRYYDENKDDPSLVTQDLHGAKAGGRIPAYLNAGYLSPNNLDLTGLIMRPNDDKSHRKLWTAVDKSFTKGYQKKSGYGAFDTLAKGQRWDLLAHALAHAANGLPDEDARYDAEAWSEKHPNIVTVMLEKLPSLMSKEELYDMKNDFNTLGIVVPA